MRTGPRRGGLMFPPKINFTRGRRKSIRYERPREPRNSSRIRSFVIRRLKKLRGKCIVCAMHTVENNPETSDIIRGLLQMEHQRIVSSFSPGTASPAAASAEDSVWRQQNTELHPYREIMVILKNDIPFQLASRVYEGHVGDIVLFDAFENHDRFHPPSVTDTLTLWMQIGPQTIVSSVIRSQGGAGKVIMRFEFSNSELCTLLNRAWHDAGDGRKVPEVANMEIGAVVNVVRSEFAEKFMTGAVQYNRSLKDAQKPYPAVVAAMNHIATHIGEKLHFDDIAEQAGYSRQHFARLFKQYSGYNFRDYIDHVRMMMFRKMYFTKYMRKNEIAGELGFSSSSSLIHWLRSVQGKHLEQNVTAPTRRHGDKGTI